MRDLGDAWEGASSCYIAYRFDRFSNNGPKEKSYLVVIKLQLSRSLAFTTNVNLINNKFITLENVNLSSNSFASSQFFFN